MSYSINLNSVSNKTFRLISELDSTLVNSDDYLGVCYFWHSSYKHFGLRDTTIAKRKRIHKAMMDNGLDVTQESVKHYKIIHKIMYGAKT
tara:strand:- start:227 stop:496 length:270 start_codon:yes stop_codon:yes gene_type:complete